MNERGGQLARSWRLIAIVRGCAGVRVQKLARELGVTERTVYRDLIALQAAGVPLTTFDGKDGIKRWRLAKDAPCAICGRATVKVTQLRREMREAAKLINPNPANP